MKLIKNITMSDFNFIIWLLAAMILGGLIIGSFICQH